MTGNLPFGLTVDDMIVLMAALAAVLTVMAIWNALVPRDTLTARARALVERRAALKAAALAPKRRSHRLRAVGLMRAVVTRLNLMRNRQSARKTLLLARAGFRSGDATIAYVFAKAALPLICGGAAAMLLFGIEVYGGSQTMRILLTLAAALEARLDVAGVRPSQFA